MSTAYAGRQITLGRMIQENGAFSEFFGVRRPLWFGAVSQTSYFQTSSVSTDAFLTHSSAHAVQVSVTSSEVGNLMWQSPDGGNYLGSRPMDYYLDVRTHAVKAMGWMRSTHANTTNANGAFVAATSGEFHIGITASGSLISTSSVMASGSSWGFFETGKAHFTGSNDLHGSVRRTTLQSSGSVIVSEFAIVMDEMDLDVGFNADFENFAQRWTAPLLNGMSTRFLSEVPSFKLPVDNVNSEQACNLESWAKGRFPLMLRMGVSSLGDTTAPAAPFSVSITGRRFAVSKFQYDSDLREGTITLEGC